MGSAPHSNAVDDQGAALRGVSAFGDGRYVPIRALGSGGQKVVYLVRDVELDRECALSLLTGGDLRHERIEQLRREAQAMAALGAHPHVVKVFDIGADGGRPFVVCEYLPGGDLRRELVVSGGRLSQARAWDVATQILDALGFVHEHSIVHRDLKPDNVWLTKDGRAKLGDFGVMHWDRDTFTEIAQAVGTPHYAAPEQLRGEAVDGRTDLYALGCMLYELLTGAPPFTGTVMSIMSRHLNEAPRRITEMNPAIGGALADLIHSLLEKSPAARPDNAAAVSAMMQQSDMVVAADSVPPATAVGLARFDHVGFVGRAAELRRLEDAFQYTTSGNGSLIVITGEPGIGKSTLARELKRRAHAHRSRVYVGRCAEADASPPFLPFIEILGAALEDLDKGNLDDELRAAAATIRLMVPSVTTGNATPSSVTSGDTQDRYALFTAATRLLVYASRAYGLLVIIEDLHWANEATLMLLQHLISNTTTERVLVLGTYRDAEVGPRHPLAQTLATLRRANPVERVPLTGLNTEEIVKVVESAAPGKFRNELVASIEGQTQGNPLFVKEILKYFIEGGDIEHFEVPEGVREVIERRLARLSDPCQRMLRLASAMPSSFRWQVLTEVSKEDEDELLDLLDEALLAQVIREQKRGRAMVYEFTHALVGQTLYEDLSTPRRVRLHIRIAEAIQKLAGDRIETVVSDLSYHYHAASVGGSADPAVEFAIRAAHRAMRLMAYEEVGGYCKRALELLDSTSWTDEKKRSSRADIHEREAAALCSIGQWTEAVGRVDLALEALSEDDKERRAELLLYRADASFWSMGVASSGEAAGAALELARETGRVDLEGHALAWQGMPASSRGEVDEAFDYYRQARELLDGRHVQPLALEPNIRIWRGQFDEALLGAEETAKQARLANDLPSMVLAVSSKGLALAGKGAYAEADAVLSDAVSTGENYGILPMAVRARTMTVGHRNALFDVQGAVERATDAIARAEAIDFAPSRISGELDLMFSHVRAGDIDAAQRVDMAVRDVIKEAKGFHQWVWETRYSLAKAELSLAKGNWEKALKQAELCIDGNRWRPKYTVLAELACCRALDALGRHVEAAVTLGGAVGKARKSGDPAQLLMALAVALAHKPSQPLTDEAADVIVAIENKLDGTGILAGFRKNHPIFSFLPKRTAEG